MTALFFGQITLCMCRSTQANLPNVGAVEQQTQMAESMVARNAALADESIRQELITL